MDNTSHQGAAAPKTSDAPNMPSSGQDSSNRRNLEKTSTDAVGRHLEQQSNYASASSDQSGAESGLPGVVSGGRGRGETTRGSGTTPTTRWRGGARGGGGADAGNSNKHQKQQTRGGNNIPSSGDAASPSTSASALPAVTRLHNPTVDPSRVVKRPIPQSRNTRQFQLLQLQRRFHFKGDDGTNTNTEFPISLAPSDPDFPYALDELNFILVVPLLYAESSKESRAGADESSLPSIRVTNSDIPVGFKINIENGFRDIASHASESATLLDMINTLDKKLEELLSAEKAATIKIVPNTRASPSKPIGGSEARAATKPYVDVKPIAAVTPRQVDPYRAPVVPQPVYTSEQQTAAAVKREQDTRQLEARLGRSEVYHRTEAPDRTLIYTLPLIPRRKDLLPVPLQRLSKVILRIPKLYNLEPCTIDFAGSDIPQDLANLLKRGFIKQVRNNASWSPMAHLNAFAANIHEMLEAEVKLDEPEAEKAKENEAEEHLVAEAESWTIVDANEVEHAPDVTSKKQDLLSANLDDKKHIVKIPRPPEWSYAVGDDDDSESDASDYDTDSGDEEHEHEHENEGEAGQVQHQNTETKPAERGTALSFPGIQMSGIQLLEVLVINVTVKCTRCKTTVDVKQIRPGGKPRFTSCEKCSGVYGVGFRMEPVHQFSNRAGFFDLAGCTITEILPSNFLPHCGSCDTPLPPPGIANLVPGQSVGTNCRQCHSKMSLFIPEMKLLRVSNDDDATLEAPQGFMPKKAKKEEKFTPGTELPDRGRCSHYKKSTRWFRFSCCMRVFPCDKCHDAQVQPQHYAEHANRMICGRCSREQNYRPNDCAYCGHSFIRKNTGYWEGGKGTRDKRLLRRNDPHKYKRVKKAVKDKEDS